VIVSNFEETLSKDSVTAAEYALATATHKALDVAENLLAGHADLVIGADTVRNHLASWGWLSFGGLAQTDLEVGAQGRVVQQGGGRRMGEIARLLLQGMYGAPQLCLLQYD
jgi:hypothetical protein